MWAIMDGIVFWLICTAIGLLIWFSLNRASVRANEQIHLLNEINNKLSKILDPNFEASKRDNSSEGYLEEARKKAGL